MPISDEIGPLRQQSGETAMHSAGLTDSALVFHSVHYTAKDAIRNVLQPQYVIDRITAHSDC
jgi:hypothetical protein